MIKKCNPSWIAACKKLILLNWLFAAFLWSTSMSTLQEAVSVLIWIGGTVTFGLFATLSIERRYTIYRIGTRES